MAIVNIHINLSLFKIFILVRPFPMLDKKINLKIILKNLNFTKIRAIKNYSNFYKKQFKPVYSLNFTPMYSYYTTPRKSSQIFNCFHQLLYIECELW